MITVRVPAATGDYIRSTIAGSLTQYVLAGPKARQDGMWAPACLVHCMAHWGGPLTIGGKTDAQAFGDWYFGRGGPTASNLLLDNRSSPLRLCTCQDDTGVAHDEYRTCESSGFVDLLEVAAEHEARAKRLS